MFSTSPRQLGDPFYDDHASLGRYRIGDYRIICKIEGHHLVVVVIKIAHRRDVYR